MAEVISRRSIVYDILFEVEKGKKSAKEAEAALGKLDNKADALGGSFGKLGGILAGVFATQKIVQFGQEAFELGLKAEGVRKAFNNLNNPKLLSNLRTATSGLVDDLTLMQASVRADKFKIPLDTLGKLFKFASVRARETGQSVNFLVDSIIDGIGRKSPLILDNLGLRAQDLQNEFAKTGDFAKAAANVISTEMAKSGVIVEGQAEKVLRLRTQWQNLKVDIGVGILEALGAAESGFQSFVDLLGRAIPLFGAFTTDAQANAKLIKEFYEKANQQTRNFIDNLGVNALKDVKFTIDDIGVALQNLQDAQKKVDLSTESGKDEFREYQRQIQELEEFIKSLTDAETELTEAHRKLIRGFETTPLGTRTSDAERKIDATKEKLRLAEERKAREDAMGLEIKTAEVHGTATESILADDALRRQSNDALLESANSLFSSFSQLAASNQKAQLGIAIADILTNQAVAISKAISSAKGLTGFDYVAQIAVAVGAAVAGFAQVFSLLNQAKAATAAIQPNVSAFAEGEVDIHRKGEVRGKDSIPAVLMPGESVMRADVTAQHKDVLQAMQDGSFYDLIHQNYIEPSLAVNALEHARNDSTEPDYSERFYRQWMETHEGNSINKKAARHLASIDNKLSGGIPEKYR